MAGFLLMQKKINKYDVLGERIRTSDKTTKQLPALHSYCTKKSGRKRGSITVQPGSNSGPSCSMDQPLTASPQCPPLFLKNKRCTHDYQKNSFLAFSQN